MYCQQDKSTEYSETTKRLMKNNTEISERIVNLIDYLGISRNDFAKKLNYKRSQSVYDICNGKSAPSYDFFNRFFDSEYSVIFDHNWIFTGKGEMLSVGYRLKGLRKGLGLSVANFAKMIGEDELLIEDIEKGDIEPSYDYFMKVKETFNLGQDNQSMPVMVNELPSTYVKQDPDEIKKLETRIRDLEIVNQELKEKLIESQQEVISLLKSQRLAK